MLTNRTMIATLVDFAQNQMRVPLDERCANVCRLTFNLGSGSSDSYSYFDEHGVLWLEGSITKTVIDGTETLEQMLRKCKDTGCCSEEYALDAEYIE